MGGENRKADLGSEAGAEESAPEPDAFAAGRIDSAFRAYDLPARSL